MKNTNSKTEFKFEESICRLDEIIAAIENNSTCLDTSLALYKEGMALAADCAEKLSAVEKEVVLLVKDAAGVVKRQIFAMEDEDD